MTDTKKTERVVLSPAGESSDPAVHDLLAHREIAERNSDAAAVKAVDLALEKLGFSV